MGRSTGLIALCFAVSLVGCSSHTNWLSPNDKRALDRLSEVSPWQFRPTRLELQVLGRDSVEVNLEGGAQPKADAEPGALSLPLVYVTELPKYYEVTKTNSHEPIELQSFKVQGSQWWCIMATFSPQPTDDKNSSPVELSLLLVSPNFSASLPLWAVVGRESSGVSVAVSLPGGYQFNSRKLNGDEGKALPELTDLPEAATQGVTKSAALLPASDTRVVSFQDVAFVAMPSRWEPKNLNIKVLLILVAIAGLAFGEMWFIRTMRLAQAAAEELWRRPNLVTPSDGPEDLPRRFSRREFRRLRSETLFKLIGISLLLLALIYFAAAVIAQDAKLSGTTSLPPSPAPKTLALADLGIGLDMKEPPAKGEATLTLDFYVVTNPAGAPAGDIGFGIDPDSPVEIDAIKPSPDAVKLITMSRKYATLSAPGSRASSINVLSTLSDSDCMVTGIGPTKDYLYDLSKGILAKIVCQLRSAQTAQDRTKWVHWFPWDSRSVNVVLKMDQPAIISRLEIQRPPNEFEGSISSFDSAVFSEEESRYVYDAGGGSRRVIRPGDRVPIIAEFKRPSFQRFILTWGLLIVSLICGLLLGLFLSRKVGPDNKNKVVKEVLRSIGGVGWFLGVLLFVRVSVYQTYEQLPSITTGRIPTIFELFFAASCLIFLTASYLASKR
jgi:hypothetical protein